MNKITIGNKVINNTNPAFIAAEIGLNHNKDIKLAKRMIQAAQRSGADAVKFQTYITEQLLHCKSPAFHIFKNLELAKKPPECLEYILVHELVHLLERKHNNRFKTFMDEFMPNWVMHRNTLNTSPLANEKWRY